MSNDKRVELFAQLMRTFHQLHFGRRDVQLQVIAEAIGVAKPINELDVQEMQTILDSING